MKLFSHQQPESTTSASVALELHKTHKLLSRKEAMLAQKEEQLRLKEEQLRQRASTLDQVKSNLESMLEKTKEARRVASDIERDKETAQKEVASLKVAARDGALKLERVQKELLDAEELLKKRDAAREELRLLQEKIGQAKAQPEKKGFFSRSSGKDQAPADLLKREAAVASREKELDKRESELHEKRVTLGLQLEQLNERLRTAKHLKQEEKDLASQRASLDSAVMDKQRSLKQLEEAVILRRKELISLKKDMEQIQHLTEERQKMQDEVNDLRYKMDFKRKSVLKLLMMKQNQLQELTATIEGLEKQKATALSRAEEEVAKTQALEQRRTALEQDIASKRKDLASVMKDLATHVDKFKDVQARIAQAQERIEKQKLATKNLQDLLGTKEAILNKKEEGLRTVEQSLKKQSQTLDKREEQVVTREAEAAKMRESIRALAEKLSVDKKSLEQEVASKQEAFALLQKEQEEQKAAVQELLDKVEGVRVSLTMIIKEDLDALKSKEDEIVGTVNKIERERAKLSSRHNSLVKKIRELRSFERKHGANMKALRTREQELEKREIALDAAQERLQRDVSALEEAKKSHREQKRKIARVRELKENLAQLEAEHAELEMKVKHAREVLWAKPLAVRKIEEAQQHPEKKKSVDVAQALEHIKALIAQSDFPQAKKLLSTLEQYVGGLSDLGTRRPLLYEVMEMKTQLKLAELG